MCPSRDIFRYNELWRSAQNSIPARYLHDSEDEYDLKVDSMNDCEWIVVIPFPFCHERRQALQLLPTQTYEVHVTFNDWHQVLVNAPAYNDNLTIASSESAVSIVTPSADAGTYNVEIGTYTVPDGRLGNTRTSMLSGSSSTSITVPSTPLTNTMFQADLLVEHIRYGPSYEAAIKRMVTKRAVCLTRNVKTLQFNSSTPATVEEEFVANLPTALIYLECQRQSRALLNDRMNFHPVSDPINRSFSGGHYGSVGPQGSNTNHFFKSVEVKFEGNQRLIVDAAEATALMPAQMASRQHPRGIPGWILAFCGSNPYDHQFTGAAPMSNISHKSLVLEKNPAVLTDQQYIGGIPEDPFTMTAVQYYYNILEVDGANGTIRTMYAK